MSYGSGASLRMNANVMGLGPTFLVTLQLQNTGDKCVRGLLMVINYSRETYEVDPPVVPVPLLVPSTLYTFELSVKALVPAAPPEVSGGAGQCFARACLLRPAVHAWAPKALDRWQPVVPPVSSSQRPSASSNSSRFRIRLVPACPAGHPRDCGRELELCAAPVDGGQNASQRAHARRRVTRLAI